MRNSRTIKKAVNRQKYTFIFYNLLAYLIIFSVLGIVAVTSINMIFFKDAQEEVKQYSLYLESDETKAFGPIIQPKNPRMFVSYFDEEGYIYSFNRVPVEERINPNSNFKSTSYELIPFEDSNNVYFITYSIEVDYPDENIAYAKIYMNIDGEMNSRNEIIKIYIICVIAISILSGIASFVLSRQTLKPIISNLKKQLNFVSDASHELRTPLTIVQSKIENILTESERTVYDISEDLAIALKEISRLNRLTNDLLVLARSDNETTDVLLSDFYLDELVKNAVEPFKELSIMQNKKLDVNFSQVRIVADRNKIYQVMIILLDNALLYTNEGDSILINLSQTSSEVILEVADTGIGISDHTKEHIFERFYREDEARNRATGGNGLGLSIARSIVTLHRGKITVNHNEPKGTKFTITIPKK